MAHWINYGWLFEIAVVGLLIYGLAIFLKIISNLKKEFKSVLPFVWGVLFIVIVQGIIVRVLLLNEVIYDSPLWLLYPALGLLMGLLVILGSRKFLSIIQSSR